MCCAESNDFNGAVYGIRPTCVFQHKKEVFFLWNLIDHRVVPRRREGVTVSKRATDGVVTIGAEAQHPKPSWGRKRLGAQDGCSRWWHGDGKCGPVVGKITRGLTQHK